ncbi:MAG: MFS transporter [Christensenellales bacterium]|jgi:oligogalacturonide transporter
MEKNKSLNQKAKKAWNMSAYALGDMLGGGVEMVLLTYYFAFLVYVVELDAFLAGFVIGIGKIWGGLFDPIMGMAVDRTRTRFGSCRPWFLISVIPIFVSYFMLWYGFGIDGMLAKFFYHTGIYIFFSSAVAVGNVPYEALLPRMIEGYQERTNFSSLRMVFSGIACVASTYIYEIIVPVTKTNPLSPAFTQNFITLGLVLGAMFALPLAITFFGTKEKLKPAISEKLTLKAVFGEYREMLSSKLYRKYYGLNLLGSFMSHSISSSIVIFIYLTYGNMHFGGISVGAAVLSMSLVFLVINLKGAVEIAFFVPNVIMMKKFNKHRPYLIDLPLLLAGAVTIIFVTPSTPLWLFLIACCLLGAGVSCLGFVPTTLLPDLSDVDELMYGKRREGVSAGLVTLGKKIVSGLSLIIFGLVLTAFNFNVDVDEGAGMLPELVTAETLAAIKIMLAAIPIVCCIIMIVISKSYGLNRESHALIKHAIEEKKEKGFAELGPDEIKTIEKITGKKFEALWISRPEIAPITAERGENEESDDHLKAVQTAEA